MRTRIGQAYGGLRSRRGLLKQVGVVGAAGLTAAVTDTTAHADAGSPAGSWSVTVEVEGQPEAERAHFSFTADGQLVMQGIRDGTTGTGIGSWRASRGGFVYALRHLRVGDDGKFLFEIRIRQEARFTSAGAFVSQGTARAVDAGGNVLMELQATASGSRFGIDY
ncbi:twin-arginine translocation signal domain-containing protein [Streptomyces sp. NBC_01618]|uniref:twin-arginine translocation signal domain-containing protein n=1 Tax=Streptomyces sp. NBC_01618 TaxID=2975900 RepID=UPI00386EBA7A|nr:twin-arginine translocation signal domain-containing protein [Streptomyces sp. NBC_01618]